jgi:hypothetical protein
MFHQVIARGDVRAAAVAAKFSAVPLEQWPGSSHEELQQLYAKATSPFVESAVAPAQVASDPLAGYKQDIRALLQSDGATKEQAVRLLADAPDASTGQQFAAELRHSYASILLGLRTGESRTFTKSSLWFVAGWPNSTYIKRPAPTCVICSWGLSCLMKHF